MFILNKDELKDYDLSKARQFVAFWNQFYDDTIRSIDSDQPISYIDELNLGNELTERNIKQLLRWKTRGRLADDRRVLNKRDYINDFRFGRKNEADFKEIAWEIFPSGFSWPIFLFHIARPFEFPIADQNVFRAFATMKQREISNDWDGYRDGYKSFFFEIAVSAEIIAQPPNGDEPNIRDIVSELKRVDNALFVFGRFLKSYAPN